MSALQNRASFLVLSTLTLITVVVYPPFNDSFNIPKYSILFFTVAISFVFFVHPKFGLTDIKNWKIWISQLVYLTIGLILAIFTDQKNLAFFGSYGRNMGWFQQLGFIILFLLAAFSFTMNSLVRFLDLLIGLGCIISLYGYLQFRGIDFTDYNSSNLPIIATLGNSNFASAFIGLSLIALSWKIFCVDKILFRFVLSIIFLFNLLVIQLSKSSQGLFVTVVGVSIFIGFRFFTNKKSIGFFYFGILGSSLFIGFLGLLQIGPFKEILYQPSTTFRGDYYRAAWKMFISSPLTGVGFDSFGVFYRQFRDLPAALRLGPQVSVDQAHNVFLQLLATGGFFLFLSYIFSLCLVLLSIRTGFKRFKGEDKHRFGALVALWFGYLLQEQVSVSQISLTAFGWVISGAIMALGFNFDFIRNTSSIPNSVAFKRQNSRRNLIGNFISLLFIVLCFSVLLPKWEAEQKIYSAKKLSVSFEDFQAISLKEDLARTAVARQPSEIQYRFLAADIFLTTGNMDGAREQLKKILELNPKSDPALVYLADLYEYSEEWDAAIKARILVSKIDPYNTRNWLQLGVDLSEIGDYQAVNKVIELVAPLAGKSTIADDLKALLPAVPTS